MSNEKLAEQLGKLKEACTKWEKELETYKKWALENDGVISIGETIEITRRLTDIIAIKARIAQIEQAKGLQKEEAPKNKLGITKEQVKDKLSNYFAAFDKFTVVVGGTTVEVETPYFMNDGTAGGNWDGNNVNAGKGSPKEVQKWLQDRIDKGKVASKDPAKLRQYLKDNKIGVDCSGFVSQALNHVADKEGDMEYGADDVFTPDGRGSGSFGPSGKEFKKIEPANVAIGDTLYFKNAPGKVNHIRIVGDVRTENGVVYYTIFESAGSTGPRKMEWKFEGGKLQEFNGKTWTVKTSDTFYRWKELDMEVPTGGGSGQGQQQDQQQTNTGTTETTVASTTLSASVGKGGKNKKADVLLVQELLNKKGASLTVDGDCGPKSISAIEKFQKEVVGMANPDGKIDPGGKTWDKLSSGNPQPKQEPVKEMPKTETPKAETAEEKTETSSKAEELPTDLYKLSGTVGKAGTNNKTDVMLVQSLLNRHGAAIGVDGDCGNKTIKAIENFQEQKKIVLSGLVEPDSSTFKALLAKPDKTVAGSEEINSGLGSSGKLGNTIIKKGEYIFSIPPNAKGSYPLMMLFSGLNQNASSLQGQVPDIYYLKSIVIFSGPAGKYSAAQALWQAELNAKGISASTISICGYSLGGQAAFREYGNATKAVGLIDPTTYYGDLSKIDAKAIFSANGASAAWDWSAKKPGDPKYLCMHARQDGIKTALSKGGTGEDTKLAHNVYPQYFLSKFKSKLI